MRLMKPRIKYQLDKLNTAKGWDSDDPDGAFVVRQRHAQGNLTSSEAKDLPGHHYPVIDLDFAAHLVPSCTAGHFHLYLDKAVPTRSYMRLLEVMAECGIIEQGYYGASAAQGRSYVRTEGTFIPGAGKTWLK